MNDSSKPIKTGFAKTENQETAADPASKLAMPMIDSTVALPPICNLPLPRNPYFTGREADLSELNAGHHAASPQVIKGVAGIGKTQIALEFAYRYASDYQAIWWIRAEDADIIASDYTGLAAALNLQEKKPEYPEAIVSTVRNWLAKNRNWLLIFDNVNKPKDVLDYLPKEAAGHVLITSRHQIWEKWYRSLIVNFWSREESEDFLTRRTNVSDSPDAANIAEAFGCRPSRCGYEYLQPCGTAQKTGGSGCDKGSVRPNTRLLYADVGIIPDMDRP